MARMVKCIKLGREADGLDFPPYPGELGKRIFENVSKEAWRQWLEHQKMLVNENQLSLADKKARDYLAQQFVAQLELAAVREHEFHQPRLLAQLDFGGVWRIGVHGDIRCVLARCQGLLL